MDATSREEQSRAFEGRAPDQRRIYDDIPTTLAFKTVKSWADTRVGDYRDLRYRLVL